jgi:tRNA pseudouridine55 synthase
LFYRYLKGSKAYIVEGELGYETTTLDMEGNVTRNALFDHVTAESIAAILPEFTGSILQVPPIFSAIQKNGKRLYKEARRGAREEDLQIEPRQVYVHQMDLLDVTLPRFRIRVECGGGVYIRSLIRDMGRRLDSAATTYSLLRTKHGPFTQEQCLAKDDWNAEKIYEAIANSKAILEKNFLEKN